MTEQITEEKFLIDLLKVRKFIKEVRQINIVGVSGKLKELIEKYDGLLGSPIYTEVSKYSGDCIRAIDEGRNNTFDNKRGVLNSLDGIMSHYPIHSA